MDYENLTIRELQKKLVELGMPQEEVENFKFKPALISTIKAMSLHQEITSPAGETENTASSFEDRIDPNEERETNRRWKSKAEKMKSILLSQPHVSILVPLEAGERVGKVEWREDSNGEKFQVHISGAIETVQLNGYKYFIPKGIYTPVPQAVAEVIAQSQQQTLNAGANISLNRIDPLTNRPYNEIL